MYMGQAMAQINLHSTPEFERSLALLMRLKRLPSKSEAIRLAVIEQAKAARLESLRRDFVALVGTVKPRRKGRFASDAALWDGQRGR
jgi:hypothetical protein